MSTWYKVKVAAGNHDRNNCPVRYTLSKEHPSLKANKPESMLMKDDRGNLVPIQWTDKGDSYEACFIVKDLPEKSQRIYTVFAGEDANNTTGVELKKGEHRIDIEIDKQHFTSYVFDPSIAKPYLGPVMSPYGSSYTRLDFQIKEHPHHRSVWLAIGDVNGVDLWNEPEGVYGKQKHENFTRMTSGPVLAQIESNNVWTDFRERPLIGESRKITFYNTPATGRFVDMDILFTAGYGKVELGASKEAGPLGIRLAESMKVDNGGTMVNSYGAVGEAECWGHRAEWCDYHGMVEGQRLGIAVYDHPDNDNYPTYWHIRNYGLMAPNNFYFIGGKLLKPGETLRYQYRIYFHEGDTMAADVSGHYHDYINPPKVEIISE